jgi:NAD(P)-dependent dehydrogenase (short-subunit alcohol dehydrogenase family)
LETDMSTALSVVQTPLADVRGKTAVVTGGSSGIGLGLARVLSAAGMKVAFTFMREAHRDHALSLFPKGNAGVHAIKLDTADREGMVRAADEVQDVFGNVHLLCNNAGVGVMAQVSSCTWDDWDWTMDVNIDGVFNGVRTFLPRMLQQGEGGHIVTTSSSAGLVAGSLGVYCTSKFAVMGMMESLRVELNGKNIGVSVFCPGLVKSEIVNAERNRPAGQAKPAAPSAPPPGMPDLMAVAMDPLEAATKVLAGIRRNDLYILTHPEFKAAVMQRYELMMQSFSTDPVPAARAAVTTTFTPDLYAADLAKKK